MDVIIALLQDPRSFIAEWIITLGPIWVYTPLFAIIFIETGLVVFPFLPGDSLLFTAGIFAADGGGLNIWALVILMSLAAILGNTSNYWVGRGLGHAIVKSGKIKALTPERMAKTQAMFDKYGVLAVVLTRFFPIIRTIAPFCAGLGRMSFPKFTVLNAVGGILWVSLFTCLGYFFGGIPFVQENFELVIIAIVAISLIPAVGGALKLKFGKNNGGEAEGAEGAEAEAGSEAEGRSETQGEAANSDDAAAAPEVASATSSASATFAQALPSIESSGDGTSINGATTSQSGGSYTGTHVKR